MKERPFHKQVTLHIADPAAISAYGVDVPEIARCLIEKYWPGPLTLVLRRGDGSTVGFRMPRHPVALALLAESQVPVVAPSANLSGNPPPRTAEEVLRDLADKIDLVLDAGPTPGGVESTVLDLSGESPQVLRRGAMGAEIEKFIQK